MFCLKSFTKGSLRSPIAIWVYWELLKVAKRILGCHYAKVATSDRHGAYNWIIFRQLCWAHLMRDFQAMIDRDDEGQAIGKLLLAHAVVMFGWWHKVRDGTWSRSTFQRRLRDFKTIFEADLREGVELAEVPQ